MSDILALLDTLDGLHKAGTPEPWWRDRDSIESNSGGVISGWSFDGDADLTIELRNAYPHLAQALRTALNLLATERAKAADAARERAAIVADLREAAQGIRSAPGSAVLLLVNGAVADAFMSAADRYESGAHNKVTP